MPTHPEQASIDRTTTAWAEAAVYVGRVFRSSLAALADVRSDLADGYPTQSMSDHSGSGELTPTEAAASARERATDLERRALRAYMGVDRAFMSLANVLSEIKGTQPTDQLAIADKANEAGGFCVNCARYGVQSVRAKSARCDACYEYRRTHAGEDRPQGLVISHERRRVVTFDRAHKARAFGKGMRV